MSQYHRGRKKEWDARTILEGWGYRTTRTAGSRGLWDVHAIKEGQHHLLIQVKYTKKRGSWRDANCVLFEEFEPPLATYKEFWIYTLGIAEPEIISLA